jgi:hypothetical protein
MVDADGSESVEVVDNRLVKVSGDRLDKPIPRTQPPGSASTTDTAAAGATRSVTMGGPQGTDRASAASASR